MSTYDCEGKKPSSEDAARLKTLIEEIHTRAQEVSRIIGVTLDADQVGPLARFVLTTKPSGKNVAEVYNSDDGKLFVGCHDEEAQMSCPGFCPCS